VRSDEKEQVNDLPACELALVLAAMWGSALMSYC
jgi:hypothetical protein